jgi:hypothetical protein
VNFFTVLTILILINYVTAKEPRPTLKKFMRVATYGLLYFSNEWQTFPESDAHSSKTRALSKEMKKQVELKGDDFGPIAAPEVCRCYV